MILKLFFFTKTIFQKSCFNFHESKNVLRILSIIMDENYAKIVSLAFDSG